MESKGNARFKRSKWYCKLRIFGGPILFLTWCTFPIILKFRCLRSFGFITFSFFLFTLFAFTKCSFVLSGPERMTTTEQLSVYVRQWHPSTLTLDLPKEVVLKDSVVEELKEEVRIVQVILSLVYRPSNPKTQKWRSCGCRLTWAYVVSLSYQKRFFLKLCVQPANMEFWCFLNAYQNQPYFSIFFVPNYTAVIFIWSQNCFQNSIPWKN